MQAKELLQGAYDIHVHCTPDVVPRAQHLVDIYRAAAKWGMAGLLLKEHTTSTVGRASVLNRFTDVKVWFYSSLALNPPIGGMNPCAVESALRAGADVIYFPTYGARNHINIWGAGKPPTAFPLPDGDYAGLSIFKEDKQLKPECERIVKMIARYDAVMATGHLSPVESLSLLRLGRSCEVKRMLVTHASEPVTPLDLEQQKEAVGLGALIEHCFFAVTESCPGGVTLDEMADQIRQIGIQHCILSSDFGQPANGPVVEGFALYLGKLSKLGFNDEELRAMIVENPQRLLGKRPRTSPETQSWF